MDELGIVGGEGERRGFVVQDNFQVFFQFIKQLVVFFVRVSWRRDGAFGYIEFVSVFVRDIYLNGDLSLVMRGQGWMRDICWELGV